MRILDAGLATELEQAGHDLSGVLWSAAVLREAPAAISAVHDANFTAGAQVATTATYQLSAMSLRRAGLAATELEGLTHQAVRLAAESRDLLCPKGWVAGSVGPYGASRADGSEYTGEYDLGAGPDAVRILREFHRPRLELLLGAGVDVLACETLPSLVEVEALVAEISRLGVAVPVWFSFTAGPQGRTRQNENLSAAADIVRNLPEVVALGVNCLPPHDVASALDALGTRHPGVVYPNSGEEWDAAGRCWRGDNRWDDALVDSWVQAGARLIGGCCRVGPDQIRLLSRRFATHSDA